MSSAGPRFPLALVTGASSGIGRALALQLAAQGSVVLALARRASRLEALATQLPAGCGGRIVPLVADLLQIDDTIEIVQGAMATHGVFDLVIAAAGVGDSRPPEEVRWAHIQPVIQTNFVGAVAVLSTVAPEMVARRRGTLVGISSLAAAFGVSHAAAYSASKAGLSTWIAGTRAGLRPHGVHLLDVRPGYVRTEMTAGLQSMPLAVEAEDAAQRILAAAAAGRRSLRFPWPIALSMAALAALPAPLLDAINQRLPPER